jgi:hypothetical protein
LQSKAEKCTVRVVKAAIERAGRAHYVSIESEDARGVITRRAAQQIGQKALAKVRNRVLQGRGAADGSQHLLRRFEDPLLFGTDEAHKTQGLVLHQGLPDVARLTFIVGQEPQGRYHGNRNKQQQPSQEAFHGHPMCAATRACVLKAWTRIGNCLLDT